jgi:hypothetical protein
MKTINLVIITMLIIGLPCVTSAQKIKLESGDFNFLKGVTELKVEYNYDDVSVGKFPKEADYIAKKKTEYNEKEPGSGDRWKAAWFDDRSSRYAPRFEEEMNLQFIKREVNCKVGQDLSPTYTLIFKTTFIEPGYNVGVSRKNAFINGEAIFVESANPEKVLAKLSIENSPGRDAMGYDFDTGYRIQEAYAKAGKELVYFIWKNYLQ